MSLINLNKENIECYTPKYAVDIILKYISKDKVIWAPFSKNEHNFANYLRELGYKVINSHYDPITKIGNDFFKYEPKEHWDIIVDNPPFKNKTKYVERAISFGKPFALFLPLHALNDNGIPKLFFNNNIEIQLLIPNQRTEFHNQPNNGISFKTIYYCNNLLPKQIIFTQMNKIKLNDNKEQLKLLI